MKSVYTCLAGVVAAFAAFPASSQLTTSLTEQPVPQERAIAWKRLASAAYTNDNKGKDSYAIYAALKTKYMLADQVSSVGVTAQVQRNNLISARQNSLELGGDYTREWVPDKAPTLYLKTKFETKYTRTAQYAPEKLPPACAGPSRPANCVTQHKESVRTQLSFSPFLPGWENYVESRTIGYSIAPRIELFHDELTDNAANEVTGIRQKGGYSGILGEVAVAFTPSFLDEKNKWQLGFSGQIRQRLNISRTRKPGTEETAKFGTISLNYFLTDPPTEENKNDWRAAIGIDYTRGEDPLTGKKRQEKLMFAFKVGHT